jgi:hypothetical protein
MQPEPVPGGAGHRFYGRCHMGLLDSLMGAALGPDLMGMLGGLMKR